MEFRHPTRVVLIPDIGALPLDVAIPGTGDPFPGTVWVIDWATGNIHIFETE